MRRSLRAWLVSRGILYRRSEKGSAAVEFALIAAPFLYLLLAVFETGLMLFSEYVIENGVAKASRMIRTGQVQTESIGPAQFKQIVCGNLASYLKCDSKLHLDVRSFEAFKDIDTPKAVSGDGELSDDVTVNAKFDPGDPLQVVVVRAYYDWELFTPGISQLSNMAGGRRLITAGAAFRNEPFAK